MHSAARFGPRHREGRMRPLLLVAAIGLIVVVAFGWVALRPDGTSELPLLLAIDGAEHVRVWPEEERSDRSAAPGLVKRLGGRRAMRVPVSAGASEEADAYLLRMLHALAYEGELVAVQTEGSCLTYDERWIARWTSFLARPRDGGLTQLHLLTVRERSREWMSPYLLSADALDGPLHASGPFVIRCKPVLLERESRLGDVWSEIPEALGWGRVRGIFVSGEPHPTLDAQQLLDRHGETTWVVERPPDAADAPSEELGAAR